VGLLPRLPGVEVQEEDRELALVLAEHLFPGLDHIDQLSDEQKTWWILVSGRVLRGDKAIARYVEAFSKVFLPSVDTQIDDTLKRQEFDFADKGRRAAAEEVERRQREAQAGEEHKAKLARLAREGELEEVERSKRLQLEEEERKVELALAAEERKVETALSAEERRTKLKNRDRREKLAMTMAGATFLGAAIVFFIGLMSGEGWVIGGSGVTGALALISMIVQMLLAEPKRLHRTG
jgi:hypothetical protein